MPLISNKIQKTRKREIVNHFSYYEYKYLIDHINLNQIRLVLNGLYGMSDPYPSGTVDSIYYDTIDEKLLSQCINGDCYKTKFRIRGYGNNTYLQMHQKKKRHVQCSEA